jgi:hypothetical protein
MARTTHHIAKLFPSIIRSPENCREWGIDYLYLKRPLYTSKTATFGRGFAKDICVTPGKTPGFKSLNALLRLDQVIVGYALA